GFTCGAPRVEVNKHSELTAALCSWGRRGRGRGYMRGECCRSAGSSLLMVRHRLAEASHVSPPNLSTPRPPAGSFFISSLGTEMTCAPNTISIACIVALGSFLTASPAANSGEMPKDFVYLRDVDPSIEQDMRYASTNNFTGVKVEGYDAPECVLVRQAAEALKAVRADVRTKGFTLKVY